MAEGSAFALCRGHATICLPIEKDEYDAIVEKSAPCGLQLAWRFWWEGERICGWPEGNPVVWIGHGGLENGIVSDSEVAIAGNRERSQGNCWGVLASGWTADDLRRTRRRVYRGGGSADFRHAPGAGHRAAAAPASLLSHLRSRGRARPGRTARSADRSRLGLVDGAELPLSPLPAIFFSLARLNWGWLLKIRSAHECW